MLIKLVAQFLPASVKTYARKWRRMLTIQPKNDGYPAITRVRTPVVDNLSDQDLSLLNRLIDWNCFTVDSHGRRFGAVAHAKKRNEPQPLPDPRILEMDRIFHLNDKHVLEIGCFEGVHTVGLAQLAKSVTAVDSRIENIAKAAIRCAMFDVQPHLLVCDVESPGQWQRLPAVDIVHHVGVLYHLRDPVQHLVNLGKLARIGMMLDTHYAEDNELTDVYTVGENQFRYRRYMEGGYADVFSGMYDHAKWLRLDDIQALMRQAGFKQIHVCQKRRERHGSRALLVVQR